MKVSEAMRVPAVAVPLRTPVAAWSLGLLWKP